MGSLKHALPLQASCRAQGRLVSATAGVDPQGRGRRGQGLDPLLQVAKSLTKLLGAAGPPECSRMRYQSRVFIAWVHSGKQK